MARAYDTSQTSDESPVWQEPPDHDSWYSAGISFVFHFCLVMLVPLFQSLLTPRDTLPPAVEVVSVVDSADMADGLQGLPGEGEDSELNSESEEFEIPDDGSPMAPITEVEPIDLTSPDVDPDALAEAIESSIADAQQAKSRAQAAAATARDALNKNLGGKPGGGQSGGGGTGRAGRAARWVLRFNTSSSRSYLLQLGGLGAEIAFPQRGDQYLYFSNLDGSPSRSVRDLSRENRIFWIDNDPNSYGDVARDLGVGSAPMMIAFLPLSVEEKMLQLELAYGPVSSEDEVLQTVFECTTRGGGYDVVVVDQKLRR